MFNWLEVNLSIPYPTLSLVMWYLLIGLASGAVSVPLALVIREFNLKYTTYRNKELNRIAMFEVIINSIVPFVLLPFSIKRSYACYKQDQKYMAARKKQNQL